MDNINPSYYNTGNPVKTVELSTGENIQIPIDCIDVIRDMPLWKGNAMKYLWRAGRKKDAELSDREKEIEDLRKAIWYINDRIQQLTYSEF